MTRQIRFTHLLLVAALVYGILSLFTINGANAAPLQQACEGQSIPNGCFFSQTTNGQGGYSVIDDPQARFWTEYQRLGGSQTVGYPISRRFVYDGFVTQAFQKLVLQWRPEVGIAYPMNVFDELSEAGHDARLFSTRQTPYPLVNFDPPGATWGEVIAGRQNLLNANPAIRARYFSFGDPLNVFGLPTSRVEDMGNHYAVRTQRAVFQQWKENVPWATAGQVTIANGGDIAKEVGWFDLAWLTPEGVPGMPPPVRWQPISLLASALDPATLFLLQRDDQLPNVSYRIMVTRNNGQTWEKLSNGQLPTRCIEGMTLDYNTTDTIYLLGCDGLYHWDGAVWVRDANTFFSGLAIQRGNSGVRGAGRDTESSWTEISRSDDSGATWQNLGASEFGLVQIMVAPTHQTLYAIDRRRDSAGRSQLIRMDSRIPNAQATLKVGNDPSDYYLRPVSVTINPTNGDLFYVSSGHLEIPSRLWRSNNADTPDINEVQWDVRHEFTGTRNISFLTSGIDSNGQFALYAIQGTTKSDTTFDYILTKSLDEGRTWQTFPMP